MGELVPARDASQCCLERSRVPVPSSLHGVPRVGSPASSVLKSTPTSCRPSRVASFPSLRGTAAAPWLRSRGRKAQRPQARGFFTGLPEPALRRRRRDLPGSWRTRYERALLSLRPRQDLCARPLPRFDVAFRHSNGVGSRNETDFGAQSHGPPTRCLRFAGWITPPPRKTRFRIAGQPFRAGLVTRWVPTKGFRSSHPPLPGFAWRTAVHVQPHSPWRMIASALATSLRLRRVRPARFSSCVNISVSNDCRREVKAAPRFQIFFEPISRKVGSWRTAHRGRP